MKYILTRARLFSTIISSLLFLPAFVYADVIDNWQWRNPLPQGDGIIRITYGNNTFVVAGDDGAILTSPDGISWTSRTPGKGAQLPFYGITYANKTLVAVGAEGAIIQTPSSEVQSGNAVIAGYTETNTIVGAPASFAVNKVVNFTATGVTGSADFSINFDSLNAIPVFYQVVNGVWKQLYPKNECGGIANVSLTGTTLNFTMSANSDCNGTTSTNTIADTLVSGTMRTMEPLRIGDINYDGTVNLHDAVLALQVIVDISPRQTITTKTGLNSNGRIGMEEAAYILQSVAGMRDDQNVSCYNDSSCVSGFFCKKNGCYGHGVCILKGDVCTQNMEPVCGCDGVTYNNSGCASVAGVNVAYTGDGSTATAVGGGNGSVCIAIYDPVCGSDGITYSNSCWALVSSVSAAYNGVCH